MSVSSASAPLMLYDIKNCDQIKKARHWLEAQLQISHEALK